MSLSGEEHNRLFEDEVVNDVEGDDYEVHSHHRNRRSIDEVEKVVELMIVADKNMADYHKLELHNYILTIMSIVRNATYEHLLLKYKFE